MPDKNNNIYIVILVIFIVIVSVVAYKFYGPKTESVDGLYDTFAQCLYDNGMRMYGSATCSFCARQRGLFEGSAQYIQEIECDPRNEGHESERCIEKNISHTPTWIFEDKDGNDVHRFEPGVVSLEKLAEVSGCTFTKDL